MNFPVWLPMSIVRVAVSALLFVHGATRAYKGEVVGFGGFLTSQGLPAGLALAWGITGFEIGGSLLLASNRLVRYAAPGLIAILAAGIYLVHRKHGWFVVGGGTNGVEYSVLLIGCLAAVWMASLRPTRRWLD